MSFLSNSVLFGVAISLMAYWLGTLLHKRFRLALLHPLLVSVAVIIAFLLIARIPYSAFYAGAKYLGFFLYPATVCLAVPLYEKLSLLKKNTAALLAGIASGVCTSLASILLTSLLFGLPYKEYVTLLPKSITSAIGMGLTERMGGFPDITVAAIIMTGILGSILAPAVCRICRITEPLAKGVAIGTSAHAMGTTRAMEMGDLEGAVSSLSLVIAGLLTVVAAPLFARLYACLLPLF